MKSKPSFSFSQAEILFSPPVIESHGTEAARILSADVSKDS